MNFDIPISADLKQLIDLPPCEDLKLRAGGPIKLKLPTGATLKAFTDISKGIPNDCSMTFSLLLQLAPLLASMDCLLRILKFIKPLIKFLKHPTDLTLAAKAVDAAAGLVECLLVPTPANMIPFVRDVLCLILKLLRCFVDQLGSVIEIMTHLNLQIGLAAASGNSELERSLQCALDNAGVSARAQMQSIEPISAILELLSPIMEIAGVKPIEMPQLGRKADVDSLRSMVSTVRGLMDTIQKVVDALGGCPA